MKYQSSSPHRLKVISKVKVLKKGVKVTVSKVLVSTKRSMSRNTYVRYQTFNTQFSKVMSKVKVSYRIAE